jgi:hypothetical protein
VKPRRTYDSNFVFRLLGGTEDNDLWVERRNSSQGPMISSVWEPTKEERQAIAHGANLELFVWGDGHPPVAIGTTHVPLGKPPGTEQLR